jgi:hypothetical protein
MPTTVQTTLFLGRERPLATRTGDGQFQLALLTMEPLQAGLKEAWRLYWLGDEARAWWDAHGATLQAGQPLAVTLTRLRAIHGPRVPEIHARVLALELAPWRHQPAANQATQQAERAAA